MTRGQHLFTGSRGHVVLGAPTELVGMGAV